jgi:bis(5'-nucleosyl)-tetraphosphatase (symmetrical)
MTLWTRRFATRALAAVSLPLATAAFVYWVQLQSSTSSSSVLNNGSTHPRPDSASVLTRNNEVTVGVVYENTTASAPLDCSSTTTTMNCPENLRLRQTPADLYFAQQEELPRPTIMHAVLPVEDRPKHHRKLVTEEEEEAEEEEAKNVLVIGDVHGCFSELQELHDTAIRDENDGVPFQFVILVGDLCNKGPDSAKVIRWARTTDHVFSVRGNHEDAALAAALGDEERRQKKKYQWVLQGERTSTSTSSTDTDTEGDKITLSDEDVNWMTELPYSITIPGSYLGDTVDTLIVHAGLIPDHALDAQDINTMITMREVLPICDEKDDAKVSELVFHEREKHNAAKVHDTMKCDRPMPWASVWKGPQRIIFGHDAKRGFQRYDGDWAIGLDTGAVYGKQLTGIILPERKIVSIDTKKHCPT